MMQCKEDSFEEVATMIENETGKKLSETFREFDHRPIASASIAQVHKARLTTGEQVAFRTQSLT
jgi:ubiquinone biosynthesis protein